jgi:hypothetical protein
MVQIHSPRPFFLSHSQSLTLPVLLFFRQFSVHSVQLSANRTRIRTVLPISAERHVLLDLVLEAAHVLPRMTHPVLVKALRHSCVVPQVCVTKATERVVASFVRPGYRIHVFEFFQRLMQMAADYICGRDGFSLSGAEKETSLAVANELFEKAGDRRMKIDLTKAVRRFEPVLDLAVTNLLIDGEGQEVRRDVLIDLDAQHLSDSQTRCSAQDKNHPFPCFLPPSPTSLP